MAKSTRPKKVDTTTTTTTVLLLCKSSSENPNHKETSYYVSYYSQTLYFMLPLSKVATIFIWNGNRSTTEHHKLCRASKCMNTHVLHSAAVHARARSPLPVQRWQPPWRKEWYVFTYLLLSMVHINCFLFRFTTF